MKSHAPKRRPETVGLGRIYHLVYFSTKPRPRGRKYGGGQKGPRDTHARTPPSNKKIQLAAKRITTK